MLSFSLSSVRAPVHASSELAFHYGVVECDSLGGVSRVRLDAEAVGHWWW